MLCSNLYVCIIFAEDRYTGRQRAANKEEALNDLYTRDGAVLSRLQKLRFFPLAVCGGKGNYLIDEQGNRLLDFSASWGAISLGHSHPSVVQAVSDALTNQAGASTLSAVNQPAVALAEQLLSVVPGCEARKVWLGHSGSDANETVVRVVTAATGRNRIISFHGAYHGGTTGSMAISAHSVNQHADRKSDLHIIRYPNPFRPPDDDPECNSILDALALALENECPANEVAAVFIEPIQSDGGLIVPPRNFMSKLADLCKSKNILVVSDEVKVGIGRSGRFACIEHEDVKPDIMVFGKGLGGGLPISAIIGPAELMDYAASFSMQTLHGNPVCASAALAVLNTIETERLVENAAEVGAYLQQSLNALQQRHSLIGDVRGRGLVVGIELVSDRDGRTPAPKEAAKVIYRAFELGLVLYYVGMNSNVLEMTPALTLSRSEVDQAVDILGQSLRDVVEGKVSDDMVAAFEGW